MVFVLIDRFIRHAILITFHLLPELNNGQSQRAHYRLAMFDTLQPKSISHLKRRLSNIDNGLIREAELTFLSIVLYCTWHVARSKCRWLIKIDIWLAKLVWSTQWHLNCPFRRRNKWFRDCLGQFWKLLLLIRGLSEKQNLREYVMESNRVFGCHSLEIPFSLSTNIKALDGILNQK